MIASFLQNTEYIIQTNYWLAFIAVFLGGLLTASNPCVLVMVPLIMGLIGGTNELNGFKKSLAFSLLFVVGLSVTFTIMGLISAFSGRLLGDVGQFWRYIVVGTCVVMGIHLLGIIKIPIATLSIKHVTGTGVFGPLFMGMLFGLVSTPCAVPVLAVILVLIAAKGSIVYGLTLLFFYALGHSALIVVAGSSMGAAKTLLTSKHFHKANFYMKKVAGILIICIGIFFFFLK